MRSVIVPEEQNVLINPDHPDADAITATKVRKWLNDPRLDRRVTAPARKPNGRLEAPG